jgi:hypothetical protein
MKYLRCNQNEIFGILLRFLLSEMSAYAKIAYKKCYKKGINSDVHEWKQNTLNTKKINIDAHHASRL